MLRGSTSSRRSRTRVSEGILSTPNSDLKFWAGMELSSKRIFSSKLSIDVIFKLNTASPVIKQSDWVIPRETARSGVNQHSTVTHYQRPNMTHPQEGGTGGEVSEILFFSAKSKRRPSLIYSMQIFPVCLSIVARRKGVSATRRGGLNWTPISLLVGHPCKLFHTRILDSLKVRQKGGSRGVIWDAGHAKSPLKRKVISP